MDDPTVGKHPRSPPQGKSVCPAPKRARHGEELQEEQSILLNLLLPLETDPHNVIRTRVMQYLHAKDVLNVCSTSRLFRETLKPALFDINGALSRFFKNPVEFRTQLGRCDALITGHFALCFLDRAPRRYPKLDIYVERGRNSAQLEEYIVKSGYLVIEEPETEADAARYFKYRNYKHSESGSELGLTDTPCLPILRILRGGSATHHMHFISWNKAFSVFPRVTFVERETIPLRQPRSNGRHSCQNSLYRISSSLGLRMRILPPHEREDRRLLGDIRWPHHERPGAPLGRRVGDSNSWVVPLDTAGVAPPATPDFVLEHAAFSIKLPRNRDGTREGFYKNLVYKVEATVLRSHSLRYRYTTGPTWSRFAHLFMRATLIQIAKLDHEEQQRLDRDTEWPDPFLEDYVFEKPEEWDYMDDQIPLWFERLLADPHCMDNISC